MYRDIHVTDNREQGLKAKCFGVGVEGQVSCLPDESKVRCLDNTLETGNSQFPPPRKKEETLQFLVLSFQNSFSKHFPTE